MARKHTLDSAKLATRTPILERKVKPDGTVREYGCSLLYMDTRLAVVEFVMTGGNAIPGLPVEVPPGSLSHGYFWARRPYNLYRMRRADGTLIAHRFDAVTDVGLTPHVILYRDLVLDWWSIPGRGLLEEDRDEFDELVAAGRIHPYDAGIAGRAAQLVSTRHRQIIAEAAGVERELGIPQAR